MFLSYSMRPSHEDCCRSTRSAGGNREHREAAPKAEAPGIHASRRSDRSAWLRRRSAAPRSRPTTFAAAPAAATRTTTRARSRRTRIEYRARDRLGRGRIFLCTRLVKKTFPEESTTRLPSCPSSALVAGPPSPAPPPVTVTPFCPSALREEQRTARHGQYYLKSAAPTLQAASSCEPVPPEQPIAPTSFPSSTSGIPPRDAMTPSRVVT